MKKTGKSVIDLKKVFDVEYMLAVFFLDSVPFGSHVPLDELQLKVSDAVDALQALRHFLENS